MARKMAKKYFLTVYNSNRTVTVTATVTVATGDTCQLLSKPESNSVTNFTQSCRMNGKTNSYSNNTNIMAALNQRDGKNRKERMWKEYK
jgi:hypothetical protein